MPIPLHEDCDPNDPHEAFTWALVGLPGPRNSPLLVHPDVLRKWSKHLWDLGFRHYPEEQTKEYHPPARGVTHWLNGAGRWAEKGTPPPPEASAPDVAQLTPDERANLVEQLRESGELRHLVDVRELDANHATVGTADPSAEDGR
ncbi:phage gene 29 protein family protein [Nocardia amamiensis]|uniref:phage gene 29 protein family protein n=1 Tax=Nocardia TaxID=1817 RepID=UPI0033EF3BBA